MVALTLIPLLGAFLLVAAAFDVTKRRVPNALVAPLAAAGVAAQATSGGVADAALGLAAGALVLALLVLPWGAGMLGGGDAKLAAATAIWLGPSRLLSFILFVAVAGAPVALGARMFHRHAIRRLVAQARLDGVALDDLRPPVETAPVAVAVLLGTFAAVAWRLP
jgi:prepilin peptidase CpaA